MEYKDLEKANAEIKTMPIHGKEYAEVNERIKAFRKVFPDGYIYTEMMSNKDGVCVFRARVGYRTPEGLDRTLGEGTAYEKETFSQINRTSYIENCETSAVGRALGMAGFGIDAAIASKEEVENAIIQQQTKDKPVEKDPLKEALEESMVRIEIIDKLTELDATYVDRMLKAKGAKNVKDLPNSFWQKCLEKKLKEKEKAQ